MAALPRARRTLLTGSAARSALSSASAAPALKAPPPLAAPIRARALGRKGKSGSAPKVADDTARSKSVVRIQELLGEGEIEGLVNDEYSILFNGTPYRKSPTELNFDPIQWDIRVGTPNQAPMSMFPAVEAEQSAGNTVLNQNEPITRSILNTECTSARVTYYYPSLQKQSSKGDVSGTLVTVVLKVTDNFGVARSTTITVNHKASRGYWRSTVVPLHGTGPWTLESKKTSANPTSQDSNEVRWQSYTEIIDHQFSYPLSAYIGLVADSEQFGGAVPNRAYHLRGRKIRVPSNYNPTTRAYTGVWNGTYQTAYTDNPAWIWLDAATNKRFGAGLADEHIDKWSLYAIAQYCDGSVPDGYGGTEPRFTTNCIINNRQEAYAVLNVLAVVFRGMIYYSGGLVRVSADMPTEPSFQVTPANAVGGEIVYSDTDDSKRPTVLWVAWNDRTDLGRQRIEIVEDRPEIIAKFGYRPAPLQSFACWSRGQARRFGRWFLESLTSEGEIAKYGAGFDHVPVNPGDVGRFADRNDVINDWGGRVVSSPTTTTVQLDRPVTLASGKTYKLWLTKPDLSTSEHTITTGAGTHSTLTLSAVIGHTVAADSMWVMTQTDLSPRLFRAQVVGEDEPGNYQVEAVSFDPSKFARVEEDAPFEEPVFVDLPSAQTRPAPPTDGAITRELVYGATGAAEYVNADWVAPVDPYARDFIVRYQVNDGPVTTMNAVSSPGIRLPYMPGAYRVEVFSVSIVGVWSREPLVIEETVGVERSLDDASIVNLRLANQSPSASAFTGQVASFEWDVSAPADWPDDIEDNWYDPFFAHFEVSVLDADTDSVLRTIITSERRFSYSFEHNKLDHGGTPKRSFKIGIAIVGLDGSKSTPVFKTVSNPAPGALGSLTATGGYMAVHLTYVRPADTDFEGVKVWASTVSGFTPNDGTNLVYKGPQDLISLPTALDETLYIRVAGYDKFGESGLTVSSQLSATGRGAAFLGDLPADDVADRISNLDLAGNFAAIDKIVDRPLWMLTERWATDIDYSGGASVQSLMPAAAGADPTGANIAAGFTGAGDFAYLSAIALTDAKITGKSLANLDSAANTKLGGIEAGATVGATWGGNLSGRPTELTDGRVSAGLDASGDLVRNIAEARATSSNLLRRTSGGLFTGELNADRTQDHTAAAIAGQTDWATYGARTPTNMATQVDLGRFGAIQNPVFDFARDAQFWFGGFGQAPDVVADLAGSFTTVTGEGRVYVADTTRYVQPKAVIKTQPNRRFLLIARFRTSTNPSSGSNNVTIALNPMDSGFVHQGSGDGLTFSTPAGYNHTVTGLVAATGWVELRRIVTAPASVQANGVYWRPRLDVAVGAGGVVQVSKFEWHDVTEGVIDRKLTDLYRADGSTVLSDASVITSLGVANSIAGQGALALLNNVSWGALITGRPANLAALGGAELLNNALVGLQGYNVDPTLQNWTGGGLPPNWSAGGSPTVTRNTTNHIYGAQVADITVGASASQWIFTQHASQLRVPDIGAAQYVTIEWEVELVSGDFSRAGINYRVLLPDASNYRDYRLSFHTEHGASPAAGRYTGTKTMAFNAAGGSPSGAPAGAQLYYRHNWTGVAGSSDTAKQIRWHRVNVRPATQQEISALLGLQADGKLGANTGIFGTDLKEAIGVNATLANFKTIQGISSGFTGQGDWATYATISPTNMAGRVNYLDASGNLSSLDRVSDKPLNKLTGRDASAINYSGAVSVESLKPAAAGADPTGANIAAGFTGAGDFAYLSAIALTDAKITGKSLANLDSSANTKLGGIATGATVNKVGRLLLTNSNSTPIDNTSTSTWVTLASGDLTAANAGRDPLADGVFNIMETTFQVMGNSAVDRDGGAPGTQSYAEIDWRVVLTDTSDNVLATLYSAQHMTSQYDGSVADNSPWETVVVPTNDYTNSTGAGDRRIKIQIKRPDANTYQVSGRLVSMKSRYLK